MELNTKLAGNKNLHLLLSSNASINLSFSRIGPYIGLLEFCFTIDNRLWIFSPVPETDCITVCSLAKNITSVIKEHIGGKINKEIVLKSLLNTY